MKQVKFGIRFTVNDYAYGELDNFIECAEDLGGEHNLTQRYHAFVRDVTFKKVKPSTLVDLDVLTIFAEDLKNRANIDYLEGHWDDEPSVVAGGKMFLGRYNALVKTHGATLSCDL